MIQIRSTTNPFDLSRFIHFPWQIYKHDPNWVPPLVSQLVKRLDVERNPFFQYAERELFLAFKDGEVAGTIAAIRNEQYVRQLQETTGFFGFFETVDDLQVAAALTNAAAEWLSRRGMTMMRGPVNGAPTDEVGVLLEGHARRPATWEAHTPLYYKQLLESLNFQKYDDVLAYEVFDNQVGRDLTRLPPKLWRVAEKARNHSHVNIRRADFGKWETELERVHHLYNVAFRSIPGHTDMSLEKFMSMANSIRPLLDPDLALLAEVQGQAVGFALALPDINEALCHLDGTLSWWNLLKLRWYAGRIRTACFKLMGVLPEFRARGVDALLVLEMAKSMMKKHYRRVEISLASEKNITMNRMIQHFGGRVYRKYRIYERAL